MPDSFQRNMLMPAPQLSLLVLALAIIALFSLSGNVLYLFGISYDSPGGSPLQKIHPSSYLLLLSIMAWAMYRNGIQQLYSLTLLRSHLFLLTAAACLLLQDILLGRPLSSAIVSYVSAALFVLLLKAQSLKRLAQLKQLLLLLLFANAAVGVYEYLTGGLIAPLVLTDISSGEVIDTSHWGQVRSAGLMGHPLTSTMLSGFFLVCFCARFLFARVSLGESLTAAMLLAALPLFGGRGAILAFLIVVMLMLIIKGAQSLQRRAMSRHALLYLLCSLLLLPLLSYAAYLTGFLDPVLSRMEDDNGSASTRLIAIEIMLDTPLLNLLLGDVDRSLSAKVLLYGSRYGIEIGWIALILTYGALLSGFLLYALYLNLCQLYQRLSPLVIFPWLYAFIAWSSGTGISGKTIMLSAALIMTILLFVEDNQFRQRAVVS
ncbi:MAG TPA: VpsF family polysaccharide biosynthesis protein [Rheinheimera sp.]|uniref:VpsF family polysaccharide biosynthesis protein n=1 Tax=Rheinheimera sp. TaxID=1869214 RepID=UPI002F9467B6